MLLTNQLAVALDPLFTQKSFSKAIKKITNVVYELSYTRDTIIFRFDVEEMENYLKVKLEVNEKHSFGESQFLEESGYQGKFKSVFDFTNGAINEGDFKAKKTNLLKKSKSIFSGKKSLDELVSLYRNLIDSSLDSIIEFEKNYDN